MLYRARLERGSLIVTVDTIDKHFTFAPHAQCVVKSCKYHIQALRRIHHLLSRDVANAIACSIVRLTP